MARLSPAAHKPILSFRFELQTTALPQANIYCKSAALPSIDNAPVIAEYGNTQLKVKGKTKWNDLQISCYYYEGITWTDFWAWLTKHQMTDNGIDKYADEYKSDITIKLNKPSGDSSVHEVKLIGAFIASAELGSLDWTGEEIVEMNITLAYDYAIFVK